MTPTAKPQGQHLPSREAHCEDQPRVPTVCHPWAGYRGEVSHGVAEPRAVPAATSRVAVLLPQGCGCCCCAGIGEAEAGSWWRDVEKQHPKIQSYEFNALRSMKPLLYGFAKSLCREEVLSRHAPPLLGPRVVGVLSRPS